MRKAKVFVQEIEAGVLSERVSGKDYVFEYSENYAGPGISLAMPVEKKIYYFNTFPPFFDGLLPEGIQLEGLLKIKKIDRYDFFSQLIAIGEDTVGVVTIKEIRA